MNDEWVTLSVRPFLLLLLCFSLIQLLVLSLHGGVSEDWGTESPTWCPIKGTKGEETTVSLNSRDTWPLNTSTERAKVVPWTTSWIGFDSSLWTPLTRPLWNHQTEPRTWCSSVGKRKVNQRRWLPYDALRDGDPSSLGGGGVVGKKERERRNQNGDV